MKLSAFLSLMIAAVGLLAANGALAAGTLRLRADSWMPYNGAPESPLPGYAIEIAGVICARNGLTLDYQVVPWEEALKAAAANEIEAVVGAKKSEATGLVLCDIEVGNPRDALVVRGASDWRFEGIGSLRTVRLGVVKGYKYWPALDRYIANAKAPQVVEFAGENPLFDAIPKLLAREIDVIAETASVLAWSAKAAGYPPNAFRIAYLQQGDPVYFAFSPKAADYAKLFEAGMRTMRSNGELAEILARYGQLDVD